MGRFAGHAHVTRPGGYWQAARYNAQARAGTRGRAADVFATNGEGTLDGKRCGINQHDRCGVDKPSGYPGLLHARK